MPCFRIIIILPLGPSSRINDINNASIHHTLRHYRARFSKVEKYGAHTVYETFLCDTDAAGFLYDLPYPFYASAILTQYTSDYFYTLRAIPGVPNPLPPRDDKVLKSIYWNAKALERNAK
jgi:hypothetical protein